MNEADFTDPVDEASFVSATHGWALVALDGDESSVTFRLYETTDGGDTWRDLTDLTVARGTSTPFTFTDDSHGWMQVGPYNNTSLLATSDGGQSWSKVWQSTSPFGNEFDTYEFPTPTDGWRAQPHHLERSLDGGRTWAEQMYPCDSEQQFTTRLSFISSTTGWLLCGTTFARDDFQLFRTTDGGATWQGIEAHGSGGALNRLGTGAEITGLRFVNTSQGWISSRGDDGRGGLFTTSDGGSTWHKIAFDIANPQPALWMFESPEFVDEDRGWVVASRSGDPVGELYRTTDGGVTWALARPPGDIAEP